MNQAYVSTRPEREAGLKQRSLTNWHLAPFCEQVQTSVRHLSLTTGSFSVQKELPVPVSWLALMLLWDGPDAPHPPHPSLFLGGPRSRMETGKTRLMNV